MDLTHLYELDLDFFEIFTLNLDLMGQDFDKVADKLNFD